MRFKGNVPSITFLATADLNAKINEIKSKILNTTNLATIALTAVVSNFVKKNLTITQKFVKLKRTLLIMIIINILLLQN